MQMINLHDAKAQFSHLLDAVMRGEEVMIARAGKPAAKMVPIEKHKPERKPGALKGQINIAADFDTPLPANIPDAFAGK